MKKCSKCKIEMEDTEFSRGHSDCKPCRHIYYQENKVDINKQQKTYKQTTGRVPHNLSVAKYQRTDKGRRSLARGKKKYNQKPEVMEHNNTYQRNRTKRLRELLGGEPEDLPSKEGGMNQEAT